MATDAGMDSTGPGWAETATGGWDAVGERFAGNAARAAPDPQKLAQDWITLWQSELSAMAADPEMRESWHSIMALWAGTMAAMVRGMPHAPTHRARAHDAPFGPARPADAPRPSPPAPASDARDAEIERLASHVATLERRLAELERVGDPPVNPKRRAGRKPKV